MIPPTPTSRSHFRSLSSSSSRYSRASSRPLQSPWSASPNDPVRSSSIRSGRGRQADSASPSWGASAEHIEDVFAADEAMFDLRLSLSPSPVPPTPQPSKTTLITSAEVRHQRAAEHVGRTLRIFAFGRCTTYTPTSRPAPKLRPITLVEVFGDYTLRATEDLSADYVRLCPTVSGVTSLALAVLFGAGRLCGELAPQQMLAQANALARELTGESAQSARPARPARPTRPSANAMHQPLQRPGQ